MAIVDDYTSPITLYNIVYNKCTMDKNKFNFLTSLAPPQEKNFSPKISENGKLDFHFQRKCTLNPECLMFERILVTNRISGREKIFC